MLKFCTLFAFVAAVCLAFVNSYTYDWSTGDEVWHFGYSQRMLRDGTIERETVHNYTSTTPFAVMNVLLDQYFTNLGITPGFDKFVARLPSVGWYILLLLLSYYAAYYLFGEGSTGEEKNRALPYNVACWTALLTCLDQTVLGQGSHIGSDVPFAAMTLAYLISFEAYRRRPCLLKALVVGAVLGLTYNVKYSATFLLLFSAIGMPVVFALNLLKAKAFTVRKVLPLIGHLLAIALVISIIVNAAYGFKNIGLTFSSKIWYSAPFLYLASAFPNLPLPWTLEFIAGFDHQIAAERTWSWSSVILGQEFPDGVWFYFPLVWLLKTPLATLAIVALGFSFGLTRFRELSKNPPFVLIFCLFVFLLSYFCFVFRTHVGIRYTLMCLPLGYLMLGFLISTSLKKAEQMILALFLLVGVGYEVRPYLGNNLAFTNSIIADKSKVYAWIADSNVDWFHNYTRSKSLASSRLGTYYFNPQHLLPGNNVFTIDRLAGVMRNFQQHAWIRNNLTPSGHFGHTLILFQTDRPTFERFLDEKRTYQQPAAAMDICPLKRVYQRLVNGTTTELIGTWDKPELYTACLKVTEPTLIELNIVEGYGAFGSYPAEHNCIGDEAGKGESLWFKLSPGIHPICARIMEKAKANWTIHRGQVELALRNE